MLKRGFGRKCHWCKRDLQKPTARSRVAATKDHVVARSSGGKRTVWCCWACNQLKANMRLENWRQFMAENPEWWKSAPRPYSFSGRYGP